MCIMHIKKQISLSNLLIICISARSAPKILFMKRSVPSMKGLVLFLKFLIIGLSSSSDNCHILQIIDIFSFLTVLSEVFLPKKL